MDHAAPIDKTALVGGENGAPAPAASADDLASSVVQMHAGERIVVNAALIAAHQAASSPHSIRALRADLKAFDRWCRRHTRIALPATPGTVADYLDARAGQGSKPASLGRYKASIAKIHQLLDLKDPTPASLVKLRLQAIRRRLGTAQRQARPLRFKGRCATSSGMRPAASTCGRCSKAARRIWRACEIAHCCLLVTIPVCVPRSWSRLRSST